MNDYVFIRDSINENTTSRDLLLQLKQTVLDAYAHQDYPSDRLAKTLFKTSTTKENTRISNVVCAFNGLHAIGKRKPEKEKDKIVFTFVRKGDGLEGHITFNPGIYAENVYYINQIPYHFIAILESLIEEINRKILQIPILSAEEKKQLLDVFNGVESAYPVDKTLDQLFAEQAERTPDQIAVLGLCLGREDTFDPKKNLPCISYKELNRQSHQLAQVLLAKGVQPDSFVGLLVDRTLEMIIGLLAILKAGAAYLPMDPDYPPERIVYMLKDCSAKILLASPGTRGIVKAEVTGGYFEIIDISNLSFFSIDTLNSTSRLTASAGRLAYLIYTSGSTSRPNGVMIQHSSVVNLVLCQVKHFQIKEKERILLFSSISFDASVEQIFIALLSGAALVVVDIDSLLDQEKFETLISRYCITHFDTVPSFLKTLHMKSNGNGTGYVVFITCTDLRKPQFLPLRCWLRI
jgi:non-ribosomal peptide synthetase component F